MKIGDKCTIEENVIIKGNVKIGNNCTFKENVIIKGNVIIGNNVTLNSGVIIGEKGLGVERDKNGYTHSFPHLGGVEIKNDVEIGTLSSIASGTIENTIIEDGVFIDVRCHVGHNSFVGKNTTITAGYLGGGSVKIGKNCYVGIGVITLNKIKIGSNVKINMGSVVNQSVKDGMVVAGFYAVDNKSWLKKTSEEFRKFREFLEFPKGKFSFVSSSLSLEFMLWIWLTQSGSSASRSS